MNFNFNFKLDPTLLAKYRSRLVPPGKTPGKAPGTRQPRPRPTTPAPNNNGVIEMRGKETLRQRLTLRELSRALRATRHLPPAQRQQALSNIFGMPTLRLRGKPPAAKKPEALAAIGRALRRWRA